MEQENETPAESENPVSTVAPVSPETPTENPVLGEVKKPKASNKWVFPVMAVAMLCAIGSGAWFLFKGDKPKENNNAQNVNSITSYDECVAAGYPVVESSPEQCSVPGGQTFVNTTKADDSTKTEEVADPTPKCAASETLFADKKFGAAFCYPIEWGTASVMDAKIDTADTGYREAVRFSANTKFIVGGVSEDWTTTVGRDVGCQEPSNNVPELSSYNTDWHDTSGEGMDLEFATRSLESSEGGYDMTETVSNLLQSGVCVQGHKVITGSRYRVISEAFYTDFSESSGITTPKAHIDNSGVLFTTEQRLQFDALLASVVAY